MTEIAPDAAGYYHLGPHRFRFEAPDAFHIHFHGNLEPEHFEQFYAIANRLVPDRPFYLVRDEFGTGTINAKTRARIIEIVDPRRIAAIVSYGASFQRRVIVGMLIRALRTFKRHAPEAAFVETESEARAWVEAHRMRAK